MVSRKPAQALGLDRELGTLTVGRKADLVVLDGDLRSEQLALMRPASVYLSGVEVVADGMVRAPRIALGSRVEGVAQAELLQSVFRQLN
jgi:cytosine/adenosine deaminase-related metal-dependent hydrolase